MTRRGLQITLGVLWVIDAALQLQPYMFGTSFATEVIGSAGTGQAWFVSAPVGHVANMVGGHRAVFNAAFALLQLAIGAGLLVRRIAVPSLLVSIGWSLAVWYLGEGLGGLTGPNAALLTGAPGAALLYAVLAAAAWPTDRHGGSRQPASWLVFGWAGYWVGGAMLQLHHGPRIGPDLAATIAEGANGVPGWYGRFDFSVARTAVQVSPALIDAFMAIEVLIGLAAIGPAMLRHIAVVVGSLIAVAFWIVGPGFSQLLSGHATDPNTPPLVVVLAVAIFGRRAIARAPRRRGAASISELSSAP